MKKAILSLLCAMAAVGQSRTTWGTQKHGHNSRICVETVQNTIPNQGPNLPKWHKEASCRLRGLQSLLDEYRAGEGVSVGIHSFLRPLDSLCHFVHFPTHLCFGLAPLSLTGSQVTEPSLSPSLLWSLFISMTWCLCRCPCLPLLVTFSSLSPPLADAMPVFPDAARRPTS